MDSEDAKREDTRIEQAQAYGEQLVHWLEAHNLATNDLMTAEQSDFVALTLTKLTIIHPVLLLSRAAIETVVHGVFALGYRAGWEAAKADSLLKK